MKHIVTCHYPCSSTQRFEFDVLVLVIMVCFLLLLFFVLVWVFFILAHISFVLCDFILSFSCVSFL